MARAKKRKVEREFGDPWFGFEGQPGSPPDRDVFFAMPEGRTVFDAVLHIEEYLQHNNVFVRGRRGTPSHMDSYGTTLDYPQLVTAMDRFDTVFAPTGEEMLPFIRYWLRNPNSQPPARLLASELVRRYKIEEGELIDG